MGVCNGYIGNQKQIFEAKQYKLVGGKQDGVNVVEIWNGGKLNFTLLADRCLDLFQVRYDGTNLSYITSSGIVAPSYYIDEGSKWLRSFGGGFICTCGLQTIGSPEADDPDQSLHGRISNIPAENLCIDVAEDSSSVTVSGVMREAALFYAKLVLRRQIKCYRDQDVIEITDKITNEGGTTVPLAVLYHCNIGYPLLSENANIYIPTMQVKGRDSHAQNHVNEYGKFLAPDPNFQEMCYYHTLSKKEYGVENPNIHIGFKVQYESDILDHFVEWKMCGYGEYVLGLEPASSTLDGRSDAIANGSQKYIAPDQSYTNTFKIEFYNI